MAKIASEKQDEHVSYKKAILYLISQWDLIDSGSLYLLSTECEGNSYALY